MFFLHSLAIHIYNILTYQKKKKTNNVLSRNKERHGCKARQRVLGRRGTKTAMFG